MPTDSKGTNLSETEVGGIDKIEEGWKDAEHVHGECCRNDMQDAEDYYNRQISELEE